MDRDRSFSPTVRGEGERWKETVVLAQQGGIGREMDRDRSFSPTGGRGRQMDRDCSFSTTEGTRGDRWTEILAFAQQGGKKEKDGQRP